MCPMNYARPARQMLLLSLLMVSLLTVALQGAPTRAEAPPAYVQRITLVTGDMALSRRMWVELFDYRVIFDAPGMRGAELATAYHLDEGARVDFAILAPPEGVLAPYIDLFAVSGQQLEALRDDPPGSPPRAGDHRLVIHVPDIHQSVRTSRELGLRVIQAPRDLRGARPEPGSLGAVSSPDFEAIVLSPDGTRIQLVSFAPDGAQNCYLSCDDD